MRAINEDRLAKACKHVGHVTQSQRYHTGLSSYRFINRNDTPIIFHSKPANLICRSHIIILWIHWSDVIGQYCSHLIWTRFGFRD